MMQVTTQLSSSQLGGCWWSACQQIKLRGLYNPYDERTHDCVAHQMSHYNFIQPINVVNAFTQRGTRRNNNVIMTSKRRHDVVLTSWWRYILRRVSARFMLALIWGNTLSTFNIYVKVCHHKALLKGMYERIHLTPVLECNMDGTDACRWWLSTDKLFSKEMAA